jgi:hypothetical protein
LGVHHKQQYQQKGNANFQDYAVTLNVKEDYIKENDEQWNGYGKTHEPIGHIIVVGKNKCQQAIPLIPPELSYY